MKNDIFNNILIKKICDYKTYIKILTYYEFNNEKLEDNFKLSKKFELNTYAEELAKLHFLINHRQILNISNTELISYLNEIYKKINADKFEIVNCFNNESVLNNKTKVLILGSITSISGIKNGYFYTSDTNQTMKLLDSILQSNKKPIKFESIKQELISARKNGEEMKPIVEKLKNELTNENIAFLDVIECCIRPKNSSLDDDIIISIPYCKSKLYEQIKNSNLKAIFTNSTFVENYFKKYLGYDEITNIFNINYNKIMSPSPAYLKKLDTKKQDWCSKICIFLK
ncbi:MAG: hypothetical protein IJX17_08340 [Clostridia bacterium]|nr:hypothetical protein [Clostridia bacterium]